MNNLYSKPELSICVPVWREANLSTFLNQLFGLEGISVCEVILASPEALQLGALIGEPPCKLQVILTDRGRGLQLREAAAQASAPNLLFLHVDSVLPSNAISIIKHTLTQPSFDGGAFDLKIDSARRSLKFISKVASLRSRWTRIPYGDQAVFLTRQAYDAIGGFMDIPLMEDVALMRAFKKAGFKLKILSETVLASARKWEKDGVFKRTSGNWILITMFYCGVSPQRLAKIYYG